MNTCTRRGRLGWLGLVAVLVAQLACGGLPATPTPTATPPLSVVISAVTATPTDATPPPAPTATATEPEEPDEDEATAPAADGTATLDDAAFICTLVHPDEATELLGLAPTRVTPGTDDTDSAGYTLNYCTWFGQGQALVLSVVDTESADEAKLALRTALLDPESEAEPSRAPDAILGDEVYWTVTETAVAYTVAYNQHAFSLALGGQVTPSETLKAALLALAQAVAERL